MRHFALIAVALIFFAVAYPDARTRTLDICWVDVEGGAATLIVTPAGESILVDTGWPGERDAARISKAAREAGINQIDHLITTHWHRDHFGGLGDLVKLIPVKNYYDHSFPELPKPDIQMPLVEAYQQSVNGKSILLKPGDMIELKQRRRTPSISLRVVAAHGIVLGENPDAPEIRECASNPKHEAKPSDTSDNAKSIAFLLKFGDWEFFDAGDLTWNVEHKLVCPTNLVGTVDVYQVTHHGMDSSNHPAVIHALQPRVAVMNNGPRKGGSASVVRLLKSSPGVLGFFALHRNVQTTPAENAEPAMTANDEEQCAGETVKLSVAPDARSYTVTVPSKGTTRSFPTR